MARDFLKLKSYEKIMIYFFLHLKEKDKYEKIRFFTQDAISVATGVSVKHLSRAIDKLKEDKLIEEYKKNIPNQRRKKVYFLSREGEDAAKKFYMEIANQEITLLCGSEKRILPLRKVESVLNFKASILDMILCLNKEGQLQEENLRKSMEEPKGEFIEHLDTMPTLKYFFGRKQELADLEENLTKFEFLVITGIAGIGKTTLTKKFVLNLRNTSNLFWYDIHKWTTIYGLVEYLGNFFHDLGYPQLQEFSRNNKDYSLEDVETVLRGFISKCEGVLIFDDFEKAKPAIVDFFAMFLRLIETQRKVKVVICARMIPEPHFYDRRDVLTRGLVYEYPLQGLDFEGCRELLESRGITIETRYLKELWERLGGHPLFFEILQSSENIAQISQEIRDIGKYLYQEIYRSLSEEERRVMSFFSVFRHPVPQDALLLDDKITLDTLEQIRERALIVPEKENQYETHDVIREFFYTPLNQKLKKLYHQMAAETFDEEQPQFRLTERSYHLIKSQQYEEAVTHLHQEKERFIKEGNLRELAAQLEMIPMNRLSSGSKLKVLMLKTEVSYAKSELEETHQTVNILLESHKDELSPEQLLELHNILGHVYRLRTEWENALQHFDTTFSLAKQLRNERMMAETYAGKGFVLYRLGEHERSIENNRKCIELARNLGDMDLELKASIEIAMAHVSLGAYEEAISHYVQCLDLAKNLKDLYQQCRILNNTGVAYYMNKSNDRALEHWERCMQLASKSGNKKHHSYALMNTADLYAKSSNWELAKKNLDSARNLVEEMKDPLGLAYVFMNYGIYYKTMKNWEKSTHYFEESIRLAKEKSTPIDLGERYMEFALMYKEKGDSTRAKETFFLAYNIYKELGGYEKMMKRIESEIAELDPNSSE